MTTNQRATANVLHLGHHPQPGGGFGDLVLRVDARENLPGSGDNVVCLLDSPRKCVERARSRLTSRVESVTAFGAGPVSIDDLFRGVLRGSGIGEICRLIRRSDVGIVHANNFRAGVVGSVAALITRRPFVLHVHHTAAHQRHPFLRRLLYRVADRIVHVSEHTRRALAGGERGHVVIRSPIDVTAFRERPANPTALSRAYELADRPTVALVGRLARNKGHEAFLEAAADVDANFLVVGSGNETYRQELESLVNELGVENMVSFTGFWEDIVDVYAAADVIAVPSSDENLPKVIQEALAWEVPVVASRSGGIPELIEDGTTGLLISPEDDSTELAAAINHLLDDGVLADELATAGHDRLRAEFDAPVVAAQLERLYDEVSRP